MSAYHERTFARLEGALPVDPAAEACLQVRSKKLKITWPAAVWEWFRREDAHAWLALPGHPSPIRPIDLGRPREVAGHLVDLWNRDWIVVAAAETGTSHHIAVWIDGSDDPQVFREVDTMPEPAFGPVGGTFQDWVHGRVLRMQAQHAAPSRLAGSDREDLPALLELADELDLDGVHLDGAHELAIYRAGPFGSPFIAYRESFGGSVSWQLAAAEEEELLALLGRAQGFGLRSPAKPALDDRGAGPGCTLLPGRLGSG